VRECPLSLVREVRESADGLSHELWQKVSELGWPGLAIAEEYGGSGLGTFDLVLLAEELGRALAPVPVITSGLLVAPAIQEHGTAEQKQRYLPRLASGELIGALAFTEPAARFDPEGVEAWAVRDGGDYVLDGTKLFVREGAIAGLLLLAARTSAAREGISLFLVDADTPGVVREPLRTMGADRQAEIRLESARVPAAALLGPVDGAWPIAEAIITLGVAAECATMAGVTQVMMSRAVAYASERVQFGKPIGAFQAIQHMCADMAIGVDGMRLSTYLAASLLCAGKPAAREVAQAKVWASDVGMKVARDAHQVHAGVAFIKDHDLHFFYDRAKCADLYWGHAQDHREKVAAAILDG
jgi:alkylation response protein AidB-like acyl-CoA dehydrogenase